MQLWKRSLLFFAALVSLAPLSLQASVNILYQGAKGDCTTDDAPAINAVIQQMAFQSGSLHAGAIYFPAAPGGCYLVKEPIILPAPQNEAFNVAITLYGDGRGVSIL